MPLLTVDGREVVESGSFTLGDMQTEAVLQIHGDRFIFRYDRDAIKLMESSHSREGAVYVIGPHAATQVSIANDGIEDGDQRRLNVVFSIRGSAPGPGMSLSTHLVTYTATRG